MAGSGTAGLAAGESRGGTLWHTTCLSGVVCYTPPPPK
jgi:hypothetical protein